MDEQDAPKWFTAPRREHEARLVVGARVRIIGGECASKWCQEGHGEIGTIGIAYPPTAPVDRHGYCVGWNQASDTPGEPGAGWYAASELELISDDVPRSAPGRGVGEGAT